MVGKREGEKEAQIEKKYFEKSKTPG